MVSVSAFVILIYSPSQPLSQPLTTTSLPPPSAMEITSGYAFQDPNNSSQVSALAIVVQPAGTTSTNFTCGNISISLVTPTASYENVYNISDFVTSSTFDNTYDANFTRYQVVAPSCSIIELNGNGNQILEPGEQFVVFLNLNPTCLNCPLPAYSTVTVLISPSSGAKLICTYNIPANISPVMVLSGS